MSDVQRALQREHAILRAVFGEADPRTQLVAGAISCGDAGVMSAVLAMRDRAVDNAKGLAAIKDRLLDDAKATPMQRYVVLEAQETESSAVQVMDRVAVGSRSAYRLEQVPLARLIVNPRAGNSGLLGPALVRMRDTMRDALLTFEAEGREEMVRALG